MSRQRRRRHRSRGKTEGDAEQKVPKDMDAGGEKCCRRLTKSDGEKATVRSGRKSPLEKKKKEEKNNLGGGVAQVSPAAAAKGRHSRSHDKVMPLKQTRRKKKGMKSLDKRDPTFYTARAARIPHYSEQKSRSLKKGIFPN